MKRFLTLTCLLITAMFASAADLKVGDDAPKLAISKFVKGEPVKELQQGQIYVVEFWATWCPPCIEGIPKLTAMQKKYGNKVVFIGVSIDKDQSKVAPFVTKMGNKMNYRVALDKVAAGSKAGQSNMASAWLKAAGQNGIPCAFIVDKEGKIAWIGHPAQMEKDKLLDKVVSGLPIQ